jgi:hypothetical protein
MTPDLAAGLLLVGVMGVAVALAPRVLLGSPAWVERTLERLRPPPPPPGARPIEEVARRVRRLGAAYHHPPAGQRFARFEGVRRAYDEALVEACATLGVPDALGELPPGQERDAARLRVEYLLEQAGLVLREPR